jgi:hypothetical protein
MRFGDSSTRVARSWPLLLATLAIAQQAHAQTAAERLMEVETIRVSGTRLPSDSVIRLLGIKVHDRVNDQLVNAACHKITGTGLVKSVDYAYDAYPDRPGITLKLTIVDEGPLLPAKIKPAADEEPLWSCLQAVDPLFTRELPPTEKALAFYSKSLEKCLQTKGRANEYLAPSVTGDSSGKLTGIVFEVRQYKNLPPR